MDTKFVTVKELYKNPGAYEGKEITVGGWVRSIRDMKSLGFLVLHDGTYFETLQVVFTAERLENYEKICRFHVGCAVIVTGELVKTPEAKPPFDIRCRRSVIRWSFCGPCRI